MCTFSIKAGVKSYLLTLIDFHNDPSVSLK